METVFTIVIDHPPHELGQLWKKVLDFTDQWVYDGIDVNDPNLCHLQEVSRIKPEEAKHDNDW